MSTIYKLLFIHAQEGGWSTQKKQQITTIGLSQNSFNKEITKVNGFDIFELSFFYFFKNKYSVKKKEANNAMILI